MKCVTIIGNMYFKYKTNIVLECDVLTWMQQHILLQKCLFGFWTFLLSLLFCVKYWIILPHWASDSYLHLAF